MAAAACFYVYVHRRKTDGRVFYVGKGSGRRAKALGGRSKSWHAIVEAHGFAWEIVEDGLTETEAFEREKAVIADLGRSGLCNLTAGGGGMYGYHWSPETLKAAAEKRRGQKRTPEQIARLAEGQKRAGRTLTEEAKRKLSELYKGKPLHPNAVAGWRASWTPERRAQHSAKMREQKSRAVICVETGVRFQSGYSAADWLGQNKKAAGRCIGECCRGRRQTAYGLHWTYA